MNSFYKKIALICLVSLTANQAAQANMWNWIKENPGKSSIGLLATVAVCLYAAMTVYKKRDLKRGLNAFEKVLTVDVYVHKDSDLLKLNPTQPQYKRWDDAQNGLSDEDKERVDELSQFNSSQLYMKKVYETFNAEPRTEFHVVRKRNDGSSNVIMGMAMYVPMKSRVGDVRLIDGVCPAHWSRYAERIQTKLVDSMLKDNTEDFALSDSAKQISGFEKLVKQRLEKADGFAHGTSDDYYRGAARYNRTITSTQL